jgi:hypothetical protein
MLPPFTYGNKTVKDCCDHDRGLCEAETLDIFPLENVALTLTVP